MTPWMLGMAADAETVWKGAKSIGWMRALLMALVVYLMTLLSTYTSGDLRAEQAVKNDVVPVLQDMDHRLKVQNEQIEELKRISKMLANFAADNCVSTAETADRTTRNCAAIAGGQTPWVK
jgi:hypothetical protein